MKSVLFISVILLSTTTFAQKAFDQITYTGKIGLSKIVFYHADGYNGGSTAKIITEKTEEIYNYCSEDENPKVQKLCLYNTKNGYNYKKNIKINLPANSARPPKIITGIFIVNGEPVNFRLVRNT